MSARRHGHYRIYPPDRVRQLKVWNEFYTAETTFIKHEGIWTCVNPPKVLSWMKGLDPASVKVDFLKRGCSWEWLPSKETHDSDRARYCATVRPGTVTVGLSETASNLPIQTPGHVTAG